MVRTIKKQLVRRTLELLKEIASREAKDDARPDYDTFWESFGRYIKLGVIEDTTNKYACKSPACNKQSLSSMHHVL